MSYLDTSVLASYYCPEPRSSRVQRLLSRDVDPTISPLVEVELHCAVARKVRNGGLDESAARRIFAEFREHLEERRYRVVPLGTGEYDVARRWIEKLASPLRALDALHLAAADANGLVLITSDAALAGSARAFGVQHRFIA